VCMKMRRRMVTVVHADDHTQKATDFWHARGD